MRVALIQQASGDFVPLLREIVPWHLAYCQMHDIIYLPSFGKIVVERHANWSRFPLMIEVMKSGFADIVVWLDADCVINRADISLGEVADEMLLLGAVCHPEPFGELGFHFNMGAMYFRRSERGIAFLEAVNRTGRQPGDKWENQDCIHRLALEMKFPISPIRNRWNSTPGTNDCLNPVVRSFHGTGVAKSEEMIAIARGNLAAIPLHTKPSGG